MFLNEQYFAVIALENELSVLLNVICVRGQYVCAEKNRVYRGPLKQCL